MISIGVVFYKESFQDLVIFIEHLTAAVAMAQKENCKLAEIIFVQNSFDEKLESFLIKTLNNFKERHNSLTIKFVQNSENNIGLARKEIIDQATADWVYLTDPDVHLQEAIFLEMSREIIQVEKFKCLGITGTISQTSSSEILNTLFKTLNSFGRALNWSFQGTSKKIGCFVDHAPTAHLLLNRAVTQEIGSFSTQMSNYGEDLDLTHRATQQGILIYYGKSAVTHHQNFNFTQALKKFFNYGKAQAFAFSKNGLCYRRLYRLSPAFGMLALFTLLILANKMTAIITAVTLLTALLLKPQLGLVLLIALTYATGTLFKFSVELYALITRTLFREKSKKSLQ